ncbi:MAG: T9SS type A sorting domain-containing protein [Bacteroidota bacterium]|nr:T9SS type A sorting domain-containing protein [Bacteroidota bacterium]
MKRILLTAMFAIIATVSTMAQDTLTNGGFERWSTQGAFMIPQGWNVTGRPARVTSVSYTKTSSGQPTQNITRPVYDGQYALNLIGGTATNGAFVLGTASQTIKFTGRPTNFGAVIAYFTPTPEQPQVVIYSFKKNGAVRDTVMYIVFNLIPQNSAGYEPWVAINGAIPATAYRSALTPDSLQIGFIASSTANANASLFIARAYLGNAQVTAINADTKIITDVNVYPNPATDKVNFSFTQEVASPVSIQVLDLNGRVVSTVLNNQMLSVGVHQYNVDASSLNTGLYIYRIQSANGVKTGKIVISK